MRVICAVACFGTAFDAARRATGTLPQSIFSEPFAALWWLHAAFFALSALVVLLRGVE